MSDPDAGRFSEKLLLSIPQLTTDALGGQDASGSSTESIWARYDGPVAGGSREAQQRLEGRTLYRFVIRQRDGLASGMRLFWRGRSLQIARVYAASTPWLLTIEAEEGGAL